MTGQSFSEVRRYHTLSAPDVSEILRYAGVRCADKALLSLLSGCMSEAEGIITPAVCFREFSVDIDRELCDLGFVKVRSHALARNLAECGSVILFAATLGIGADRLISRYSRISPSRAVMLDAVFTERIEAVCDIFEREVTDGRESRPRFSAGYGDLPLEMQKDIFRALNPEKHIGLTLNESLLMSPSKSVTAMIGLSKKMNNE